MNAVNRWLFKGSHLINVYRCKRFISSTSLCHLPFGFPRLSPQQVKSILRKHDLKVDIKESVVKYYESNQLASNNPIEDRRAEGHCLHTDVMFFGVFDGHGGCACAQAISERLIYYLTLALMPSYVLENHMEHFDQNKLSTLFTHDNDYINDDRAHIYSDAMYQYAKNLLSADAGDDHVDGVECISELLTSAFVRLDADISSEAMPRADGTLDSEALHIAFSGACACVAVVHGQDLYIANSGDCRALLVSHNEKDNTYTGTSVSSIHDSTNEEEVHRIHSEHPSSEAIHLIRGERLLGQLVPTRAFGDVMYKWQPGLLRRILQTTSISHIPAPNYRTPPYLTAQPQITHHKIKSCDKCLVLATDGLWDMLSPDNVASILGKHIQATQTVEPYSPHKTGESTLGAINRALLERKVGLASRSSDDNSATHLIRHALGGTDRGVVEHSKISNLLCIPEDMVRSFRDDITVTVIYFDNNYIK